MAGLLPAISTLPLPLFPLICCLRLLSLVLFYIFFSPFLGGFHVLSFPISLLSESYSDFFFLLTLPSLLSYYPDPSFIILPYYPLTSFPDFCLGQDPGFLLAGCRPDLQKLQLFSATRTSWLFFRVFVTGVGGLLSLV